MRIAPLHEEGALTPRCPWGGNRGVTEGTPRSPPIAGLFSVFSVPSVRTLFFALRTNETGVSRRREKKKRLRRDARGGLSRGKWFLRPRDPHPLPFFPLCSLCPLCEPCFSMQVQKRIAPSRKERALTPRCLFSPCPLCEPCFSMQVQKRIAPSRREGALTPR